MNYSDIAELSGFHKSTVSRALRNSPKVNPKTREKILQTARDMGYKVNPLVSAWMSHVRDPSSEFAFPTVAWINLEYRGDLWRKENYLKPVLNGARNHFELNNFSMQELWLHAEGMTVKRMIEILKARGIQGILLPYIKTRPFPDDLIQLKDEFYCINLDSPISGFSSVCPNLTENFDICLNEARKLGYRKIGFCAYARHEKDSADASSARYLNYNANIPKKERVPLVNLSSKADLFKEGFMKWFEKHRPEAIIVRNPQVFQVLNDMKIQVPEDVGIIHTNLNSLVAGTTGIDEKKELIGGMAAAMLISRIRQGYQNLEFSGKLFVTGEWIEGNTTRQKKMV